MKPAGQQKSEKLLWQQPEQLGQPEVLQSILAGTYPCWSALLAPGDVPIRSRDMRVVRVTREPLKGGVSGAQLERLVVEVEMGSGRRRRLVQARLIWKRLAPAASWLMRTSGDTRCREVQLWRSGLLDDLPCSLYVPILAAAYNRQTGEGALLMADMCTWLGTLEDCFLAPSPGQMMQYLDHLARLHAHYWQDARLSDPRLGLASLEQALLLLSPTAIADQHAAGDTHFYLSSAQAGWAAFFEYGPKDALGPIQRVFAHPAAFLANATQAPITLVHGDAWPPNMGTLPGSRGLAGGRSGKPTILIDWALATAGPATYDPFWLLFAWRKVPTLSALHSYRERLLRHLARRGIPLSAPEWLLLVDLGVVRTVLTCGETMGQGVLLASNAGSRTRAIEFLAWWTGWAARVIKRRGWDR